MKKINENKIAVAIVAIFVGYILYQNVVAIPEAKIAQEKLEILNRNIGNTLARSEYDECINSAYTVYSVDWDTACREKGLKNDCALPLNLSDRIDALKKDKEDKCLKIYTAKLK